jgi:hypothetical protein
MFSLFKKFTTKQINVQNSLLKQTAEFHHLMQSMTDLAELTPDRLLALGILRSLPYAHCSQLIQRIKAMDLQDLTAAKIMHLVNVAERPKPTVAAVAGVKRKPNSSSQRSPSKRFCSNCKKTKS